jgi:hypothetical protein
MPRFAKGSPEAIAWGQKMRAMRGKKKGDGILGSLGGLAGTALGAIGGPVGSAVGSHIGSAVGDLAEGHISGLINKKRGKGTKVEKAVVGKGVQLSKPMKKAMMNNFSVEMPTVALKAESKGKVDSRVKPSSDLMTLSPYQLTTSPAMNPFVPTTYFQEGGQSSGYGEAKPPIIKGSGVRRRRSKMGMGLYGAGLYAPSEHMGRGMY